MDTVNMPILPFNLFFIMLGALVNLFYHEIIQYVNLQTTCIIIPINTQAYFIYCIYLQREQNINIRYVEDQPFVY